MADRTHRTRFELTATDQATRVFQTVGGGLTSLKGQYVALGAAASAAFGAGGIAAFITDAARYRATLDDIADTTGDNVRTLDGLARQYKISTGSVDGFAGALAKLGKNLNNADDDGKAAAEAINAIGLSLTDLQAKKPGEAMLDIAKALGKFEDVASKVSVAVALMGKEGAKMLPYLKDLAEAGELHGKVTAEEAAQAERLEKEWRKLQIAFSDSKHELATGLIPYMAKMLEQLREGQKIAGSFWSFIALQGTINPFRSVAGNIQEISGELEDQERMRAFYGSKGRDYQAKLPGLDSGIANNRKRLEILKFMQRQEALELAGESSLDARDLMARQKPLLDFKPTEKTGKGKGDKEAEREYLHSLVEQKKILDEAIELGVKWRLDEDKKIEALKKEAEAYRDLVDPARIYLHDQEKLNKLIAEGIITKEEALVIQRKLFESKNAVKALGEEATVAAEAGHTLGLSFTSALERVVFDSGRAISAMELLKAAAMDVAKVIYGRNVAEPLAGMTQKGIAGLFSGWGSTNAYASGSMTTESAGMMGTWLADGGVMTSDGPMPLRRYASGGVASSPQVAIFGEGANNEAFVPLPDGRRIPVAMQGGGGSSIFIDARGADRAGMMRLEARIAAMGASMGHVAVEAQRREAYRRGRAVR